MTSLGALAKVLALIKKTGDRCIVLSSNGEDVNVVMSLPEYERLALGKSDVSDLTENQLLDKINRDIAIWKTQQTEEIQDSAAKPKMDIDDWDDDWDEEDEMDDGEEDPYYFESV